MGSLGVRLAAGALVFIGIALFLTWEALGGLFYTYVEDRTHQELQAVTDGLTAKITIENGAVTLAAEPLDPRFLTPAGGRYWQISENGAALMRSRSLFDSELPSLPESDTLLDAVGPDGEGVVAHSMHIDIDGRRLVVTAASPHREIDDAIAGFKRSLAKMIGLTGVAILVAAAAQIAAGLAPLARLRRAVGDIRSGRLARMPDDLPSELTPLIGELNTLLDERDAALERAQARANDLAHGLKTPLTVLSHIGETLSADSAHAAAGEMIVDQVDTVRQRVDRQLALARIRRRTGGATDAAPLLHKLIAALAPQAAKRGVTLGHEVEGPLPVAAAAVDLAEAVGNVLENAVEWAAGAVHLSAKRDGAVIRVAVSDDGPGIAPERRAEALGRGGRLDESRKGSGLGLAIAADIMDALGGTITLERSAAGGLEVWLDWPAGG